MRYSDVMLRVLSLGLLAGVLTGCLTHRQTAIVGGSGVALSVVAIVAIASSPQATCNYVVPGDESDCGREISPVGAISVWLAIPLLAGAAINLIAGPVTPRRRR